MLNILSDAKMSYNKLISYLFCIGCLTALFLIVRFFYVAIDWPIDNNLTSQEIISYGFKYMVFGSQNTNGIDLYDIKNEKFIRFIIPENKKIRYILPVINKSGRGYCIRKDETDINHIKDAIVAIDVNHLKYNIVRSLRVDAPINAVIFVITASYQLFFCKTPPACTAYPNACRT